MQGASVLRNDYLWLAVIVGIAVILRVVGINAPLWFDEIVTVDAFVRLPWGEMLQEFSMNNHYLFTAQAKASALLFGEANWVYRFPAALFGIGTVVVAWWLAREIAGAAVAHVSALLIAVSYHQIWFSQNARGYTELAFWSMLAMILFLRGVRTPSRGVWIAYGLTLAAAVFTHLTGAFFFITQGLVWLGVLGQRAARGNLDRDLIWSPLIGAGIGVALLLALYAPALPTVLDTVGGVSETSAIDVMQEYQNPVWTVIEGVRTAVGNGGLLATMVAIAVLTAVGLGAMGSFDTAPLFALTVAAHIVLTLVLLSALGMRIWPRFFFVDIAFVMILIVIGVSTFSSWLARFLNRPGLSKKMFLLGAVFMVLASAVLLPRNYLAPKQNLAGAFDLVEATRATGDRVYSVGQSGPLFASYFKADWGSITSAEAYAEAVSEPGPLLLVVPFPARSFRVIPALDDDLGSTMRLIRRFPGTLGDGSILVIRRD